jgi:endogenous inhibitor of DNA gyrase (YacG/DUF329 family)
MKTAAKTKARWVRCPACGGQALYGVENPSRPFCSVRCRNVDLGAWASESYRMACDAPSEPDDSSPIRGSTH